LRTLLIIPTEGEAFVEAGGKLALEFGERPTGLSGLDLVEGAFLRVLNGEQQDVVRPTESKRIP